MKQIICCIILLALSALGLSATSKTIPELYKLNNGRFTSDYSTTYNNPVKPNEPMFGASSEAGDINNDGIPDILLGNPTGDNSRGIVYVIYGKKGSLRNFNTMDDFQPSDGFIIKGSVDGQRLGYHVSAAGDVNGDGIDDIVIGTAFSNANNWNTEVTAAYVLFGRKSSSEFPSVIEVGRLSSTQGFKVLGTCKAKYSAIFSVSGAGDVNGDGVSDIIIGDSAFENAYVVFGSRQGLTDIKLGSVVDKVFAIIGYRDALGSTVSKVGDFNGDGVDDIIIGAHVAEEIGKAYLIYGRRGGFPSAINVAYLKESDGMVIQGINIYDHFGCAVSQAGDFNGDGLQDVIIGAYGGNGGKGAAYVILGSRQNPALLNVGSLSASRGFNIISTVSFRYSVSVGGGRDINGDGKSDIIGQIWHLL